MCEKKRNGFSKKQILYTVLIGLCSVVFLISAFYLGNYFWDYYKQSKQQDDLASIVESHRPSPSPDGSGSVQIPSKPVPGQPPQILPEYQPLYEMNDDLVGWISIPDTTVNYPVLKATESLDFYLNRDFYKKQTRSGSIYVRDVGDVFAPSDNITIYGHRMKTGNMFTTLHEYLKKSFWESHKTFSFDTLYEHHQYEIFAVFKTTGTAGEGFPYHLFVDAENAEEFDEFVAEVKRMSFYDTGITPQYGDKLVCLSTCEYTLNNGRLVVVGRRIS